MTTHTEHESTRRLLRFLAWVQAVLIAVLLALLLRGSEPAPPAPAVAAAPEAATSVTSTPIQAPAPEPERQATPPSDAAPPPPTSAPAAPADTVLYGRVVNEAGEAISEGVVWFSRPGQSKTLATVSLRPGQSQFAVAGLLPGKLDYRARVTGYKEQHDTIEIPAGVPRLRRDIVLTQAWSLRVKLQTPEGRPLHEVLQEASKDRRMLFHVQVGAVATAAPLDGDLPPTPYREIETGLGRWQSATGIGAGLRDGPKLPRDVAGVIELDRRQPLWVSAVLRHRVLTSAAVQPGQPEVVLTVSLDQLLAELGTLRGRVVDAASGAPVANADVGFGDLQSSGAAGKSDEQGRFEVKDLRPGLLDVEIRAGARNARRDLILLPPGQVLDLGDVPVFEFRQIQGRCEGLLGKAEGCRVAWTPLDPPSHPAVRRHTDSTSVTADGAFTLHLPDGRYRLRASGAGGAVTEIDTRTLGNQPVVLKLAREAPLRVEVQSNGEPWELAVFDGEGREVYRRGLRDGWKFPLWFLPGDYRVELTDRRGKMQARQVRLAEGGADLRVP